MRTFVAVFPPPEVQGTMLRAARALPVDGEVRWTRPENVHLTLKFLGEVAERHLDRVSGALEGMRGRHEPFEAEISGLGAFPSVGKARILWVGVGEGAGGIRELAHDVEGLLEPVGFDREDRPYVPHLTLGRARRRPARVQATGSTTLPALRFPVAGVDLVRSVPGASGVTYETLATHPFR